MKKVECKYWSYKKTNGRYEWSVVVFTDEKEFSDCTIISVLDFGTEEENKENMFMVLKNFQLPLPKKDEDIGWLLGFK